MNTPSYLKESARCSKRHIKRHVSQYELYTAGLPHQHLSHETLPQVFQIAGALFSFLFLLNIKTPQRSSGVPAKGGPTQH